MVFASTPQEQDPSIVAARDDADEPASFFPTEKAIVEASAPISIRQYPSNVAKEVTILEVAPLVLARTLFFYPPRLTSTYSLFRTIIASSISKHEGLIIDRSLLEQRFLV